MAENTNFERSEAKKERFEFVLTVNGNIICKRYFRINNFKERSLGSLQLIDAIDDCVAIINNDLKAKSNIYLWYTAPQVFSNAEQMNKWVENPTFKLRNPAFVVLNDTEEFFLWNGEEMLPYDKRFNVSEYLYNGNYKEAPSIFKFSFYDNGREIHSVSWDGSIYPKFVRTYIDISNSTNKYKADGSNSVMEEFLTDRYIESLEDNIPLIVKRICSACSRNDVSVYNRYEYYGDKKYDMNIQKQIYDYYKRYEIENKQKTDAYFAEA